jgi:hypothetical protein
MLVMMKRNVTPLCDRHHKPMQLAQFGASNIALNFVAHRCMVESCSRVYQHGHGYIDVTDVISFEQAERRDCPEDQMTLYLAAIEPDGNQIWHCGQVHCEYIEKINPHERFHVMLKPISAGSDSSSGNQPYAQMEAVGTSTGEKLVGPCLPWPLTLTALSVFGQNAVQVAGIRNSLLNGTSVELAGIMSPLCVPEQQLRKAGLKRPTTSSSATSSPIFI